MVPPLDRTPGAEREASRRTSEDATGTADSVEWRDISTAPTAADAESADDVATRIHERSGDSLTVEISNLTVTLVGVPRIAVGDLVDARHRSEDMEAEATRHCALFDIENTGDVPLHWLSRHTTFVGSDGNGYGTADLPLDSSQLPPGCHTNHIGIESRCRARVMTPVEALPEGVTIKKVIHTIADARYAADQRLLFTL
ncbi:MAG: hypothetical protein J07HN6_00946 [Halonotius sp. J07HN6]|jgi:hypothetical protein|nr:MAG: hypothetical protein J07HN6_00946 [Halonotius sp. J07HN6]